MKTTYKLNINTTTLLHVASKYWLINDVDEPMEREQLKVKVKSGDYLSELATNLDEISQMILDSNEQQSVMLQHAINDLLFLEKHYQLLPKPSKTNEVAIN